MDGSQVLELVIVACFDVVDGVCSCVSADVADAFVSLEHYQASSAPVFRKPCLAAAPLPGWSLVS